MKEKRFQKREENFVCKNCDFLVRGEGYTNHCPQCLWSFHIDINPGDRSEVCQGMMRPIGVEVEKGGFVLYHRCTRCKKIRRVKTSKEDNIEKIIHLTKSFVKK